jgi:hypothetical protein
VKDNKDIVVYWGVPSGPGPFVPYILNVEDPSPLIIELKKLATYLSSTKDDGFIRCPSVIGTTKNSYMIKSPIDIDITYDGNKITSTDDSQLLIRDHKSGFMSLQFIKYIFFTEEDNLTMRIRNPHYNITDFTRKCSIIEGQFNIGQWFRGLDCAFYFRDPGTLTIRKGDPLFYVEFQTESRIKFQKFYFTTELAQIQQYCLQSKKYNNFPLVDYLESIYLLFRKSKMKSQLLKNIKNNLLNES